MNKPVTMLQEKTEDNRTFQFTKTNKELDALIYHVTHNLRAPLASILGLTNLGLLHKSGTAEDLETYFSLIRQSVLKMDSKLAELLHYSQNALSEIHIEAVDFSKILYDAFDAMKYREGHENIEFQASVNDDQPFYSDVFRITAIVENLISNAIKYSDTKKEKSFIHVKVKIIPEQALITFHDNGIGIAEDQLDKVFNMFYRATETSSGSGLGLYLVGEMMDKLKGNIEIASAFGKETHITLTIPNNPPPVDILLKNHYN
jgi:signal transduction histidine kinase